MKAEVTTHPAVGTGIDLSHLGSELPHGVFATVVNNQANIGLPPKTRQKTSHRAS